MSGKNEARLRFQRLESGRGIDHDDSAYQVYLARAQRIPHLGFPIDASQKRNVVVRQKTDRLLTEYGSCWDREANQPVSLEVTDEMDDAAVDALYAYAGKVCEKCIVRVECREYIERPGTQPLLVGFRLDLT